MSDAKVVFEFGGCKLCSDGMEVVTDSRGKSWTFVAPPLVAAYIAHAERRVAEAEIEGMKKALEIVVSSIPYSFGADRDIQKEIARIEREISGEGSKHAS